MEGNSTSFFSSELWLSGRQVALTGSKALTGKFFLGRLGTYCISISLGNDIVGKIVFVDSFKHLADSLGNLIATQLKFGPVEQLPHNGRTPPLEAQFATSDTEDGFPLQGFVRAFHRVVFDACCPPS